MLRTLLPPTIAATGLMAAAVWSGASTQPAPIPDDVLLRAAYCVGVLKESARNLREVIPSKERCATEWQKYKSVDECRRVMGLAEAISIGMAEDFDSRLARYRQYVVIRTLGAPTHLLEAVQVVALKGERDTIQTRTRSDPQAANRCVNTSEDFATCLAKFDQVGANIVRCQQYPDQLPF